MKHWQNIGLEILLLVLVILYTYTGVAKLVDFGGFRSSMLNQPFPTEWAEVFALAVPVGELALVALLLWPSTRLAGMVGSLILMTAFTTYVALIYIGAFPRVPCGCAGIFDSMSWGAHLVVNLVFVAISAVGIYLSTTMPAVVNQEVGTS
ncbi:MauE/DoxX family redox-associated membrane protein [Litoribacter populi]|uniref:MauE/DoxX family redox-associated membrane protein n=1 Tax=Litoribacter populi TaxID=2598460 RepID=UPI00117EEB47|nr:MauE/DoxX family redox-associated membrane protein [Litoribacter populi]